MPTLTIIEAPAPVRCVECGAPGPTDWCDICVARERTREGW